MEENTLIRLSQKGDEAAFSILVNVYQRKVFQLAFSFTQNRETSDDLAQEIFIKAYYALPKFKGRSKFGTWLYQISLNHIRDFLRKESRLQKGLFNQAREFQADQEDILQKKEREIIRNERKKLVRIALESLPEKYRLILTLREIHGVPYVELAELLNLSPGTVDSRLFRARKLLRKKLSSTHFRKGGYNEMP